MATQGEATSTVSRLFLQLVEHLIFHFPSSGPLFDSIPILQNLPTLKESLRGHSALKLEQITAFKGQVMLLTGWTARAQGVEVVDYTQNAASLLEVVTSQERKFCCRQMQFS